MSEKSQIMIIKAVIFDLDDTLILNCVGRQWFREKIARLQEKGINKKVATKRVVEIIKLFPEHSEAQTETVEPGTVNVLKQLHTSKLNMMVLTARSLEELPKGSTEMISVGIWFEDGSICNEEIDFGDLVGFSKGVLCAAYKPKGEVLGVFLDRINYIPKRIIFIDDKVEHVVNVCEESKKRGIPYIGFHYRPASICSFDFAKIDKKVRQAFHENDYDMAIYDAAT